MRACTLRHRCSDTLPIDHDEDDRAGDTGGRIDRLGHCVGRKHIGRLGRPVSSPPRTIAVFAPVLVAAVMLVAGANAADRIAGLGFVDLTPPGNSLPATAEFWK